MGGRYPYSSYRAVSSAGWAYGDTLVYPVTLADSVETGNLLIALTHDNLYPYSNLWLEVTIIGDSALLLRDTVDLRLCDTSGRWFGRGIEGYYQLETPLCPQITLPDSATITLRHIMRADTIHSISQIGLYLEKP